MNEQAEVKKLSLTRQQIAFYLDDLETPVGRLVSFGITGLILLSSAIFVALTYPISTELRYILEEVDQVIVIIFACEYLIRF